MKKHCQCGECGESDRYWVWEMVHMPDRYGGAWLKRDHFAEIYGGGEWETLGRRTVGMRR